MRHKYFAIRLMKEFPVSSVLLESHITNTVENYVKEPSDVMKGHFIEFDEMEKRYFQKYVDQNESFFKSKLILEIAKGAINSEGTLSFLKKIDPKVIAVHSTSLIGEKLISEFPRRLINLHAGLSPYYRGSATNVWPFFNNELEYVGMTVHYIDKGIDSGDIILQGRPEFEECDNTHSIGCKNVILGTDLMVKVIRGYLKCGPPQALQQDKNNGKLYMKKHFTDKIVLEIKNRIENGLVKEYARCPKKINIVES